MVMSLSYRLTLINTVDGVSPKDAQRAATFLNTAPPHPFGEGRAVDVLYTPDAPTDAMALATAVRDLWGDHPTPFDLCVQDAAAPRQKRLLLSDMDATIVAEESLDVLADYAGCGQAVATITARAMRGDLDFHAALRERVALLRGQPATLIDRALSDMTLSAGASDLVTTMRGWGAKTILISGGFTPFTQHVAAVVGFDDAVGNTLGLHDGHFTGEVLGPIVDKHVKQQTLLEQAGALNLSPADTLAVGDGANDLLMLQAAGLGVAYRGKPLLKQSLPTWVDISDLTALLYMQGWGDK